jgi:hypothetical protein
VLSFTMAPVRPVAFTQTRRTQLPTGMLPQRNL